MKLITKQKIAQLLKSGHVVAIYPRKKMAVVDGFKYFKLTS